MKKILIVEDDPTLRIVLTKAIELQGHKVETADNIESAFDLITAQQDLDIIISDYNIPNGGEGLRLLSRIRRDLDRGGLKFILISSDMTDLIADQAAVLQANMALPKTEFIANLSKHLT
jgi:two-component system CheB/CheR fusion protein